MNRYILSSFIAFILVSMGLSSLIVGATNYIQNKKSESGKMMFSLLVSVFLWDFGYAWMSLCFDSDFAYVPRAIALLGTVFYQFFLVKYISSLVNFSERNFTPFYVIFVVASLIVWTQIIGKSAVTFQSTPWGYWYTTYMSPFRVCQFILAISSTFIFYYIVLTKLRKNKLSRLREIRLSD